MKYKLQPTVMFPLMAIGLIIISGAIAIWRGPSGIGEERKSPNGKFIAHASNMSRGEWWGGRTQYIDLRVEELATKKVLWQTEYYYSNQADLPDYSSRAQQVINWAPDSSAVTIPISLQRKFTLPLP